MEAVLAVAVIVFVLLLQLFFCTVKIQKICVMMRKLEHISQATDVECFFRLRRR